MPTPNVTRAMLPFADSKSHREIATGPQARKGRQIVARGDRSCENIVGGEGPLSRNAAILRVLPTAAETGYGHDIRLPFFGWGSWPLRLSFSLRLGLASGELSSGGGTIAEYCK